MSPLDRDPGRYPPERPGDLRVEYGRGVDAVDLLSGERCFVHEAMVLAHCTVPAQVKRLDRLLQLSASEATTGADHADLENERRRRRGNVARAARSHVRQAHGSKKVQGNR